MRRWAQISCVAALLLATGVASAQPTTYGDANQLYAEGKFEQAAEVYQAIARGGVVHEDLYYNLGNALFRIGRLGPAVYNYERALRIDPNFDDARYNLAVAREVIAERFGSRLKGAESQPLWVRISTYLSIARLTLGALLLNILFFGVLIGLRFLSDGFTRTALVVTNAFVGTALVVFVVLLIGHSYFLERVELGVVLPDQVVMREGADERRAERGLLHPGLRVEVIGRDVGWLRVRLSNGVDGWVPESAIGTL